MKELVKTPELFGVPAYEWLDGKGKITKRFAAFSARVAGGKLEIVERETGTAIRLDFDSGLVGQVANLRPIGNRLLEWSSMLDVHGHSWRPKEAG